MTEFAARLLERFLPYPVCMQKNVLNRIPLRYIKSDSPHPSIASSVAVGTHDCCETMI